MTLATVKSGLRPRHWPVSGSSGRPALASALLSSVTTLAAALLSSVTGIVKYLLRPPQHNTTQPASPATRDRIANSQSGSGHCAESVFLRVGRHQLINKELQTFDKVCPPPQPSAECTFKEEVRHKSLCLHFLQSDNH